MPGKPPVVKGVVYYGSINGLMEIDRGDPVNVELSAFGTRIRKLVDAVADSSAESDFMDSLYHIVGAVYALLLANKLGFKDTTNPTAKAGAVRKRSLQLSRGIVHVEEAWMAGFHFQNALLRIATVYQGRLETVAKQRKGQFPQGGSLRKITNEIIGLTHEARGRYTKRRVSYQDAVNAVRELLDLLETSIDAA